MMMKNKAIRLITFMLIGFVTNSFSATITENFDLFSSSGYGNYTYNSWQITDGLAETNGSRSYGGTGRAVRLDDDNGSTLTSPSKIGGIGTISFWYRNWSSPAIDFYVFTSPDNSVWNLVDSVKGLTNTTYVNFIKVVNDPAAKYIKVVSSGQKMLLLDEFNISDNSAGCTGYFKDSISSSICSFDSAQFRGVYIKTAGLYKDTVNSTCDTIFMFNLITTNYTIYSTYDTICSTDSLFFNGSYLKTAGIYYDTILRTADCDSIVKLALLVKYCPTPCNDLLFSEYIEGGGTSFKAFEIYNPTSAAISLSGYFLKLYTNGSSSAGTTLAMSGSISSYGVYVISASGADASITAVSNKTSGVANFNGNDVLELLNGTTRIDIIGTIGSSSNYAKDKTIIRNGNIAQGNTTYTTSEWTVYPKNYTLDIGYHASNCNVVCIPTRDTVISTVCFGDSATNGVKYYSVTGLYSDTLTAISSGCDSIRVLNLTVSILQRDTVADTICQGSSVVFGTQTLSVSGNYSDTAQTTAGCDSITVMELLVNNYIRDTVADTICQGASIVFGTQALSVSGNYSDTAQTTAGCDSITVMELLVNDYIRDTVADTICQGSSIVFVTQTLLVSGNYSDTAQTTAGCESITVMELLVNDYIRDTVADTICQGASVVFGIQTLTVTGNYYDTVKTIAGCDSITVIELLVNVVSRDTVADTICQGESIVFGIQTLTVTGNYYDTVQTTLGCDSITVMELLVNVVPRDTIVDTICQGESILFGIQTLTVTGNYYDTVQTTLGCDSITVMELLVNVVPRDTIVDTICQGESILFGIQTLTVTGNYYDTVQTTLGCDSITVMELLVNVVPRDTVADTICQGASVVFGTQTLTVTGNYYDTAQTRLGCDSITVMELLVNVVRRDTLIKTICNGSSYAFRGNSYSGAGFYSDTLQTALGCDSISTLDLRVTTITTLHNITLCAGGTFRVGPSLYSIAGTYTNIFPSVSGCDSTITTNLSFYAPAKGNRDFSICLGDSIQVLGVWYFSGVVVNDTLIAGSINGCDSITVYTVTTRTVTPALSLGADVISCITGGVTIIASNSYDTYSWSNGGNTNVLSVTGSISGVSSTNYILNVTQASSGCSAADTVNVKFLACVGLDENKVDLNVDLYPNPATNFVTVDVYNKYNSDNMKLEILNSVGQIVSKKSIFGQSEKVIFDVTNFSKGMYFVRISSDRINMTKKLLIQR